MCLSGLESAKILSTFGVFSNMEYKGAHWIRAFSNMIALEKRD